MPTLKVIPDLPDEAVVSATICMISWCDSDADGRMRYSLRTTGDVPVSTLLGLLELAKHDLLEDN